MKREHDWLATRVLRDAAKPRTKVEVQLGFPERLEHGDWRCGFRIKGLNRGKIVYAGGTDALQALMNALDGIATQLRESGRTLSWMDMPGETGIRRQIPIFFGPSFATEIESHIDGKIAAFVNAKQKAVKKGVVPSDNSTDESPGPSSRSK